MVSMMRRRLWLATACCMWDMRFSEGVADIPASAVLAPHPPRNHPRLSESPRPLNEDAAVEVAIIFGPRYLGIDMLEGQPLDRRV